MNKSGLEHIRAGLNRLNAPSAAGRLVLDVDELGPALNMDQDVYRARKASYAPQ